MLGLLVSLLQSKRFNASKWIPFSAPHCQRLRELQNSQLLKWSLYLFFREIVESNECFITTIAVGPSSRGCGTPTNRDLSVIKNILLGLKTLSRGIFLGWNGHLDCLSISAFFPIKNLPNIAEPLCLLYGNLSPLQLAPYSKKPTM